ncbi:hypothetical protein [Neobacillus cucumis]|uniref:hypothetical protein n=1 Tax=Neobacillus cucumis TaxID=1740721 RepID=UPI0019669B98|nr:hypothetical protein [Neobacillus cucumis]MBM7656433.1 hypothetical protein [Neobacillus cucumis]MED4224789.1 hypothetical protein [Neobacillus cucumis]
MQTCIVIPTPLRFKTFMEIALEVTFSILDPVTHNNVKRLLNRVPNNLSTETLTTSMEEKNQIRECLNAFKQSRTYYWVREDFLQELKDLEGQC